MVTLLQKEILFDFGFHLSDRCSAHEVNNGVQSVLKDNSVVAEQ